MKHQALSSLKHLKKKNVIYTCHKLWTKTCESCSLCHWHVQLILAYSWARPATLVAGKGRGGMFLFLLFLHFYSCSSFFPVHLLIPSPLLSILSLFSLFLGDDTKWPTRVDMSLNPNSINQSKTCEIRQNLTFLLLNMACPVLANSVDLDLHCLSLNMWISIKHLNQVIWLAGKLEVNVAS